MTEEQAARRAGLYMRISRDQTGEGLGVERQEDDCRTLARQLGWDVVEVYVDNDISATSGKPRPAYRKMLTDLQAGTIDAIIAWHPDRLYRRATDLGELVEIVQRHRTPVATAKAGDVDLNSPTGLLVAEMLAAIAMYEVRHKAERTARSVEQRRGAGLRVRTGNRLFGYTDDMDVLDHEAAVARVMAAKIREGGTILGVARWLKDQGVSTTPGKTWTPQGIKRYLTNPRLAGYSTLNGEIVAEGKWEPILDRDTFETVRALLTARTRAYVPRRSLLLSLLYCGGCGHRMITSSQRGKRTYRCPNRPSMPGCGRVSGNAEPIEEYVEGAAAAYLADPQVREAVGRLRSHPTETLAELNALELRVIELEQQLAEPGVPVAAISRAINAAKERCAELAAELATRGPTVLPAAGMPWPEDLGRRRALIDLVITRIELLPTTKAASRSFDPYRVDITRREF